MTPQEFEKRLLALLGQRLSKSDESGVALRKQSIRIVTAGGGSVVLERQAVGYKTGSGWVKTAGRSADERAIFWEDNLTGVTIVIKPTRTQDDAEGWFVYTAYPDRAQ